MSQSSQVIKSFGGIVVGGTALTTPVAPSSAIANVATVTTVGANTGTSAAGLSLITATDTTDQSANIMRDFKSLQEDVLALKTTLDLLLVASRAHNIILP